MITFPRKMFERVCQETLLASKRTGKTQCVYGMNWEDLCGELGCSDDPNLPVGRVLAVVTPEKISKT